MSRTLPVSEPNEAPEAPSADLQGTVTVFDPAMCCATGLCGPGVDPALLQIARDLRWLAAQGVTVTRFGLGHEPQAFVANAHVQSLLQTFGEKALPAVLVNDDVLTHGRYPGRDELVTALRSARPSPPDPHHAGPALSGASSPCCAPGSNC